jgi:hypothetical protein
MAAGIETRLLSMGDVVAMMDARAARPGSNTRQALAAQRELDHLARVNQVSASLTLNLDDFDWC